MQAVIEKNCLPSNLNCTKDINQLNNSSYLDEKFKLMLFPRKSKILNSINYHVLHLRFVKGLDVKTISIETKLSKSKIYRIIHHYVTHKSFYNLYKERKPTIVCQLRTLKDNIKEVFLKESNYRLTILELLSYCRANIEGFPNCGKTVFYTFIKKELGLRYLQFKKYHKPDSQMTIECRQSIAAFYSNAFLSSDCLFFSFDATSICKDNLSKKKWTLHHKKGSPKVLCQNSAFYLHMLVAINESKVFCCQIVNTNLTGDIVYEFFKEFILEIRLSMHKQGKSRQVFIALDNSPLHKTEKLLNLCKNNNIFLIFNTPSTPDLNPIEFLFGMLKKHLSRYISLKR